jgi:hypothetical protein
MIFYVIFTFLSPKAGFVSDQKLRIRNHFEENVLKILSISSGTGICSNFFNRKVT